METKDVNPYQCSMKLNLDNASINGIYSNGRNQIRITTSYEITVIATGDDAPNQKNATVTLVNFLDGSEIKPYDPKEIPKGTAKGWKYWNIPGDYVNPFSPTAGSGYVEPDCTQVTTGSDDDTGPQYRYFWLYNDSGDNDPISVAMSVSYDDGKNIWPFTTAQSDANAELSVAVVAVRPKVYGISNTNGGSLDSKFTKSGHLDSGPSWYQKNYFLRITDPNFNIKSATLNFDKEKQTTPFAIIQLNDACYFYYMWYASEVHSATISPLNISVEYNERKWQLCITQVMVSNYYYQKATYFDNTTATIFDDYGNESIFTVSTINSGSTPQLVNNNSQN